jgi:hypothetical protein
MGGSVGVLVGTALLATGCTATGTGNQTASASSTTWTVESFDLGPWGNASVPASVCGGVGWVRLHDGQGVLSSTRWTDDWNATTPSEVPSQVQISVSGVAARGDMDGDGRDESVVSISCDNGGGMAGGLLADTLVVFRGSPGDRSVLGSVTTTPPGTADGRAAHFDSASIRISPGLLSVDESWYGGSDGTCCPSGRTHAEWAYDGTTLVLRSSSVTAEAATG